jgi:hypothetical protein
MDTTTFRKLTFGNIISEAGRKLMVHQHSQDALGNTKYIGVIEAFSESDAPGLTLENPSYGRTVLTAAPDGKFVLMGETITPTQAKK